MKKSIGIIGGMGPLATADLFEKIIHATDAARDQDFPHVIVDCNTDIPDRTAAILSGGEDPVPQLVRSAHALERAGAQVLAMPCNTAHWFYDELCRHTDLPGAAYAPPDGGQPGAGGHRHRGPPGNRRHHTHRYL